MYGNREDADHADTCTMPWAWRVIYKSKDAEGKTQALELICEHHETHWWWPPLKEGTE